MTLKFKEFLIFIYVISMVSKFNKIKYHAINSHTPPTALILLSAVLLKNLALTTIGVIGSLPLPNTLKYPNLVTSTTAT